MSAAHFNNIPGMTNAEDRIYTIKEVADMLSISPIAIKAAIANRELECYRFDFGTNRGVQRFRTRISQRSLEKWLEHTKQKGIIR